MRTFPPKLLPALSALALLGACARNPRPAAPAPEAAATPAPAAAPSPAAAPATPSPAAAPGAPAAGAPASLDLSGDWDFVVDLPGQRLTGVIQLRRSGTSYTGNATPSNAEGSATLTSLTMDGSRVVMIFDTPDGPAQAQAVLADAKTMNGTVTYLGSSGPFTARRP